MLGRVTGVISTVLGAIAFGAVLYGLVGRPVPSGYWAQLVLPFRRTVPRG